MPRHIFLLLHQIRYKLASSLHPRWYFNRPSLPLRARNPISIPRTPTPPSIQTGPLPRRPHLLDDEFPSGCLDACGPCLCFRCGPPPRLSALGFVFEQAGGVAFGDGAAFAGEGGIRGFVLREGDEVGVGDAARMREWRQENCVQQERAAGLPVRMIAVDMDGTLLGGDGKVSARNLAALHAAEQAGIEVVVATGRRHCYAMRQLRGLGLNEANALVSSNGTVTRTIGATLIERNLMAGPTALWLCRHLNEFRNALVITFDKVGPDGEDERGALVVEHLEELHGSIDKWMTANAPYIAHVVPIERALPGGGESVAGAISPAEAPIQMMLCGTVERMRRAEARLLEHPGVAAVGAGPREQAREAEVALHRTEYPERDLSIVDILPAGCSKGAALVRLAARRGIRMEEMMAIGDNWNDVSMLEVAGRAVLMENAPADLKQSMAARGWTPGGRHDADGVAVAIEAVLEESHLLSPAR